MTKPVEPNEDNLLQFPPAQDPAPDEPCTREELIEELRAAADELVLHSMEACRLLRSMGK